MTEHSSKKKIIIESEDDVTHQADETEPADNGNCLIPLPMVPARTRKV
ncbi:MAG: hypothetical protein R2874_07135 [Desulfobacterales bacterium]